MKKSFRNRIINEGMVDTKKYRYCYCAFAEWTCIKRIPIGMVGTTESLCDKNYQILEKNY